MLVWSCGEISNEEVERENSKGVVTFNRKLRNPKGCPSIPLQQSRNDVFACNSLSERIIFHN